MDRTIPIQAEYPPPGVGEEQTGVKPSEERKGSTDERKQVVDAPDARVTSDLTMTAAQRQSSHSKQGAVSVLDCTQIELMQLTPEEIAKHDVKWLRQKTLQQLEQKRGMSSALKQGEELLLYSQFGHFFSDEQPLSKAIGRQERVFFFRRAPHQDPFNIHIKLVAPRTEGQSLTLPVTDDSTIKLLCEEYKFAMAHQVLLFEGVRLEDDRTIGSYKLPAEGMLELNIVPL